MNDAFNERLRLIRFRRKRENTKFRQELRVIPRWLLWTCLGLYLIALIIVLGFNQFDPEFHGQIEPAWVRDQPVLAVLALTGLVTLCASVFSSLLFTFGYVYRDAKRRGMNPALWTIVVLILSPGYGIMGLIIYLLVREPLPYPCPQCATSVSARYNYCPNCKTNLHPACGHCQREVSDLDKFCPYCGTDIAPPSAAPSTTATTPQPAPEA